MAKGPIVVAALTSFLVLGGCGTSMSISDLGSVSGADRTVGSGTDGAPPAGGAEPPNTGSIGSPTAPGRGQAPASIGPVVEDDIHLGKRYYRSGNFSLAEQHFRRAVELHPNDGEAWVGLAAACDKLRRFELADQAYQQAIQILGRMPSILNNYGYSYMLRGDFRRARALLTEAQTKDPGNARIRNNIELLNKSQTAGHSVR